MRAADPLKSMSVDRNSLAAAPDAIVVRNPRPVIDAEAWCIMPSAHARGDALGDKLVLGSREWTHALKSCKKELENEANVLPTTTTTTAATTAHCSVADAIETVTAVCLAAIAAECERACATMRLETAAGSRDVLPLPIGQRVVGADAWCRMPPPPAKNRTEAPPIVSDNAYVALFRAIHLQRAEGRRRFSAIVRRTIASLRCSCHRVTMAACESFDVAVRDFRKTCDTLRATYEETLAAAGDDGRDGDALSPSKPPPSPVVVPDIGRSDPTARRMAARWRAKKSVGMVGDRARSVARGDILRAHVLHAQASRLNRMIDDACADVHATATTAAREIRTIASKVRARYEADSADFSRADERWAKDLHRLAARCARTGDADAFHETVKAFCSEETRRGDVCEFASVCDRRVVASNRKFQKAWFRAIEGW